MLLVGLVVATVETAAAQSGIALDDFTALENEGDVYLSWTLRAGSTCNGIQIQRSTDSLNFLQIGEIPGVCGSNSAAQRYTFVDSFPVLNQRNFYRLEFGGSGFSPVIDLLVLDYGDDQYLVFPNPFTTRTMLCASRGRPGQDKIYVKDSGGNVCWTESASTPCQEIDLTSLPAGVYLLEVEGNNQQQRYSKKLLKVNQ